MSAEPMATTAEQQAFADRWERELLEPYGRSLPQFWSDYAVETALVVGCGPSLSSVRPSMLCPSARLVTTNNAHRWAINDNWWPILNVFMDPVRFVEQATEVPQSIPVAAMFNPAKPASVLERWFEIAHDLGDRFIPLRGTGQNGRASRIDREKLEPWNGMPVLSGSVICPAIQLASMMATRNIVLLGVDMDWSGPQPYWDGVDRWMPNGNSALYETTGKKALETWRDRLKEQLGIKLWKGTPGGKVDCLEEWLG